MAIETVTIPLADVLNYKQDSTNEVLSCFMNNVVNALERFECENSTHHTEFLKTKAVSYEESGTSRTYLMLCSNSVEDAVNRPLSPDVSSKLIVAYYTVGISCIANNKRNAVKAVRRILQGVSHPRDGSIGCYVIGELCRSDAFCKDDLPGKLILAECIETIKRASAIIGGSLVLVDSRKAVLESLYAPFGFLEVETADYETLDGEPLITSVLKLEFPKA